MPSPGQNRVDFGEGDGVIMAGSESDHIINNEIRMSIGQVLGCCYRSAAKLFAFFPSSISSLTFCPPLWPISV